MFITLKMTRALIGCLLLLSVMATSGCDFPYTVNVTAKGVSSDGGTALSYWMQMGPGRSGLSVAIESMPDKEQKIVFVRMREFEAAIGKTLAAIKRLAEHGVR